MSVDMRERKKERLIKIITDERGAIKGINNVHKKFNNTPPNK